MMPLSGRRLTLAWQFALGAAAIVLFQGLTLGLVTKVVVEDSLGRELEQRGMALLTGLRSALIEDLLVDDRERLRKALQQTVLQDPHIAWILVADGNGLARVQVSGSRTPPPTLPGSLFLSRPDHAGSRGSFRLGAEQVRVSTLPVTDSGGDILMVAYLESASGNLRKRMSLVFPLVTLLDLLACWTMAWYLGHSLSRPLRTLAQGLEQVAQGRLDFPVNARSAAEIVLLSRGYETMRRELQRATEERERMSRQVAQAEKMAAMGTFVAGMAHQVNNPLSGILSCLEMLDRTDDPARRQHYRVLIRTAADRLNQVIGRLLAFARRGPPIRREMDLGRMVDEALALLEPEARRRGILLTKDLQGEPSLWCDPQEITDLLVHLVLNALQATPSGGRVEVHVKTSVDQAEVEVHDSGPGIPESLRQQVFDPFFTSKPEGTGLGLYLVQQIALSHGGEVVPGESPLGGARFTVRFPRSPSREVP